MDDSTGALLFPDIRPARVFGILTGYGEALFMNGSLALPIVRPLEYVTCRSSRSPRFPTN